MMKKAFLVVVTMVLISKGIIFAQSTGTVTLEEYVRKELISFTWGSGNYQLGSNWKEFLNENGKYIGPKDAWGETTGPTSIKINEEGNIFIQDTGNNRILIFDKNGRFLQKLNLNTKEFNYMPQTIKDFTFDKQGNICFLVEGSYGSIKTFDHTLKFAKEQLFEVPKRSEFSPRKIRVNSNGEINIFDITEKTDKGKIIKINSTKREIEKKIDGRKYLFTPTMQQESVILKERNNEISILSHKSFQKRIIKLKPETKNSWESWISKVVDEDRKGNNFLLISIADSTISQKVKYTIQKYSSEGIFEASVVLNIDDNLYFAQNDIGCLVDVDNDGNIYHLWIKKEGARLVFWKIK